MAKKKPPLRAATHDVHDGPQKAVCSSCHKLPRFCKCGPGAVPNCPICQRPAGVGKHFPDVLPCEGAPVPRWLAERRAREAAEVDAPPPYGET